MRIRRLVGKSINKVLPNGSRRRRYLVKAYRKTRVKVVNFRATARDHREYAKILAGLDRTKESIILQTHSLDKGGLEEVVAMLARGFRDKGFNVFVFLSHGSGGMVEGYLREEGINIVPLHENEQLLDSLLKKLPVKLCNLHYSTFGLDIYARNGVKTVYTIHNNYIWDDDNSIRERKRQYPKVTKFIAVSDQVREAFARKYDVPDSKIVTVPNGSDISLIEKTDVRRADFGLGEDDFVFLSVATFSNVKAHILMIAAFDKVVRRHKHAKLVFVGNSPDKIHYDMLVQDIRERKLEDRILILDFMPKDKIIGLYDVANCLLIPSLSEGFSMASIEAASRGLPLIMTDIGGARHIIREGVNGILIKNPYDDILSINPEIIHSKYTDAKNFSNLDELVDAMCDMVEHEKTWSMQAKREVKNILEQYAADKMIDSYIDVFQKM